MNCIHLSNYDKASEPIIIMELINILKPLDGYYFTRTSKRSTQIEVVLDEHISYSQLLTIKQSMLMLLDIFQEEKCRMHGNYTLNQGEVKLIRHHFPFEETLMVECLFNINSSFRVVLAEIYFYMELNDVKSEELFPVLIYQISKVAAKHNFSSEDLLFSLIVGKNHFQRRNYKGACRMINKRTLQEFESKHAALLKMLRMEWHKLCIKINQQVDFYMKQHGYYIMSTLKRPTEMNQAYFDLIIKEEYEVNLAERTSLISEFIANVFTTSFAFLNVSQAEKQQYVHLAYCIAKEDKISRFGRF